MTAVVCIGHKTMSVHRSARANFHSQLGWEMPRASASSLRVSLRALTRVDGKALT